MTDSTVFVSYSRKQFYFAESLAMHLLHNGVPTWFDTQRLEYGSDWDQSIQAALHACTGLVLVASRAALASSFVRTEWTAMLAAHKPVYVILFEATTLPSELSNAPIYDARTHFDRKALLLADDIRSSQRHCDALPQPNILSLPTRLPAAVGLIVLALTAATSLLLALAALLVQPLIGFLSTGGPVVAQPLAAVVGVSTFTAVLALYVYQCWSLTYRRCHYDDLRWSLLLSPVVASIAYLLADKLADYLTHGGSFVIAGGYYRDLIIPYFLGLLVVTALGWSGYRMLIRSADVLRWLPTGEASQALRSRASQGLIPMGATPPLRVEGRTYQLHCASADRAVADQLKTAIGGSLRAADENADWHIAILSNQTSQELAGAWAKEYAGQLVCVAATSVRIPANASVLQRFQWLDYRHRAQEQLAALVHHLQYREGGTLSGGRAALSLAVVPESLQKRVTPRAVRHVSYVLRTLAALSIATGLFAIVAQVRHSLPPVLDWRVAVLALPVGLLNLWLALGVITRRFTHRAVLLSFVLAVLGVVGTGVGSAVQLLFPQYTFGSINLFAVLCVVGPIGVLWYRDTELKAWLPVGSLRQVMREGILATTTEARLWAWPTIAALGVTELLLMNAGAA